jgi:tRNA1Val (adenine37-N6)-methyltransferase
MSSINTNYTFYYSQPENYKFSHDSVFLARLVHELLAARKMAGWRALDLCAGCGIVGLDFLFHGLQANHDVPARFDFMEIQDEYEAHFTANRMRLAEYKGEAHWWPLNYNALQGEAFAGLYDLILCNPPYFRLGQGKLSPSAFKNRCRFYIDSDYESLIEGILAALKPGGEAYILLRDLSDHGFNLWQDTISRLDGRARLDLVGDVRGTDLARIFKRRDDA